jgi:lipoyl(octanoyl) transferase
MQIKWYGCHHYEQALSIQKAHHNSVCLGQEDIILGFEHFEVVTLGRSCKTTEELYENCSLDVHKTDRGGLATVHSPGQLVIYPIVDLKKNKISPQDFVCLCLKTTKLTLQNYDIKSELNLQKNGVFAGDAKIAFCGLRIENGVSRHGLSINFNNNLDLFKQIRVCGAENEKLTSLTLLTPKKLSIETVFNEWCTQYSALHKELRDRAISRSFMSNGLLA